MPKLETKPVAKVVVTPCAPPAETKLELMVNPDVLQLLKPFNFDRYWTADKETRKRIALDFLQEGLLEVAEIKHWDKKPLEEAYTVALVSDRPWTKAVTGPDRRTKAQAWCRYDSDQADVSIVFSKRGDELCRTFVATVKPGDVWIRDVIGKLEWLSNTTIRLSSRDGTQSWEVNTSHL